MAAMAVSSHSLETLFSRWKIWGIRVVGRKCLGSAIQERANSGLILAEIRRRLGPTRRVRRQPSILWQE